MSALLEIENLTKSFGGLHAVSAFSGEVSEGEILGIIGPNGAGKTTTFNLISGMLRPDEGATRFRGEHITGLKPHEVAERGIARTFQAVSLFDNMNVLENVMVGRHCRSGCGMVRSIFRMPRARAEERAIRASAMEWLEFVGLAERAALRISALPFMEQKLVEFARALATEPGLIMFDEPAAGLSAYETNQVSSLIRKIRDSGITVLIIEHDMELVMGISDRIAVLNYGKKIAEGRPEEVQNNPEVISVYLGTETDDAAS